MRNDCEQHLNTQVGGGGQERPKSALWLAALLVGACVIAWPWLSGRVTLPWDAKAQFLPQLQFLAQSLARGESPFWTPNVFGGHPQIADAQSLIFSPPYFLLALLDPAPTAWAMDVTLYLFLMLSAAAFFAWLSNKGVGPLAAFAGALSFAFGASMAWRIQHTGQVLSLAYLPFVLLFLDQALKRRSVLLGMGAGLAAAFLVLGRDQVALRCVYFLAAYVLAQLWLADDKAGRMKQWAAPLLAGGITGAAVIVLPILMTLLLAQDSNRPAIDLEGAGRGSLHPALFLTALAPDAFGSSGVQQYWGPPSAYWDKTGLFLAQNMGQLYIGAISLIAIVWGMLSGALWRGQAAFFAGALVVTAVYALGWYTPVFAWMHGYVPGVNMYRRPADATFLIGFLGSVLATYALDDLLKTTQHGMQSALATGAVIITCFAALTGLAVQAGRLPTAMNYILLPAALFAIAGGLMFALVKASGRMRNVLAAAVAIFVVCDLAYSNGPGGATGLPPGEYEVLDPGTRNATFAELKSRSVQTDTRRDRVELVGLGFHWPNASLTHGLEHTLGYNPVRLSWTTGALGAGDTVGLPEQKGFSPLLPSYRSPLADLLGLRWIASRVPIEEIDKTLKAGDLPLVARTADAFIYENTGALPRVLFATRAEAADFDSVLKTGAWPRTDFAETVLLDRADIGAAPGETARAAGTITIKSYTNARVEIEADSPDGGYGVLNDIWHPWWFATLDGKDIPVHRANVIFRAVAIPPGKHSLVFTFQPVRGALKQFLSSK